MVEDREDLGKLNIKALKLIEKDNRVTNFCNAIEHRCVAHFNFQFPVEHKLTNKSLITINT